VKKYKQIFKEFQIRQAIWSILKYVDWQKTEIVVSHPFYKLCISPV